jgi:hypothetical protein
MSTRTVCIAASAFAVTLVLVTGAAVRLDAQAGSGAITFHKDVEPILQKNCQSCHRPGQVAPMSLLTYEAARPWARAMKNRVVAREMPPWHADPAYGEFVNERRLSGDEIETIAKWVDAGAPQGNPADAPPPITWPDAGWVIKPDVVVKGAEFKVPNKGVVEWLYLTVPSGFTTDTWVTSMELRPGNAQVTHHYCVFFRDHTPDVKYGQAVWDDVPRDANGVTIRDGSQARERSVRTTVTAGNPNEGCYEPGVQAFDYRAYGAAKLIRANTDVVFQMHYTPTGREIVDQPEIGFTIAKQRPNRQFTFTTVPGGGDIAIPPNNPDWKLAPQIGELTQNVQVVMMQPHMHLRGKSMKYTITAPGHEPVVALNVPKYDFNWQTLYFLRRPIELPKGTQIRVEAAYDNSATNRHNPNPNTWVYGGEQSWEEMSFPGLGLIFDAAIDYRQTPLLRPVRGGTQTASTAN